MAPERAPEAATRRARLATAAGTAAILGGALAYTGLRDPHAPGFGFPPCPFRLATGWLCPGCGGLRMTHDLLHGDLAAAFTDNAFVLIGLPLVLIWFGIRRARPTRSGTRSSGAPILVLLAVSALVWTVIRNLPGFPLVPTSIAR